MATATPILAAHLALLAGVDSTTRQLPIQSTEEHPLGRRASRHHRWAPITADELDHLDEQVEATRAARPHSPLLDHADGALAAAMSLAGCDLPIKSSGSEMTWAADVDIDTEVERTMRHLRGEQLPPRKQQAKRQFTRPSQRGTQAS